MDLSQLSPTKNKRISSTKNREIVTQVRRKHPYKTTRDLSIQNDQTKTNL